VLQCRQTPAGGQRRSRKSGIKSVVLQCAGALQSVAAFCSVLQCVAVCCSVCRPWLMNSTAAETAASHKLCCSALVRCRVLQDIAVCCSVLQCVAVCRSVGKPRQEDSAAAETTASATTHSNTEWLWRRIRYGTHVSAHTHTHLQHHSATLNCYAGCYEVATISRLLKNIGLFCKRALYKRLYSAEEIYIF